MKEDLIQFIWRSKILSSNILHTTSGEAVEILHTGNQNYNQGPDFLFARIKINEILWVGHVEIHVHASEWEVHKHQEDPNYQNTILHVVWYHDKEIDWSGRIIPCIELKELIHPDLLYNYQLLMLNRQIIPCQHFLNKISPLVKGLQIERMMMERMVEKTEKCKSELSSMQWDWEGMLYTKMAHYMVAPINCDAMDKLCQNLPFSLISKLYSDPFLLASAFFGVAGLLQADLEDDYPKALRKEFEFLKMKFNLATMDSFEWKLLRLRPSHFPALRIAQLTSLLTEHQRLFSAILEARNITDIYKFLEVKPHEYWHEHYTFNKKSSGLKRPALGKQTKEIIIINAICPLLFAYGSIYKLDTCMDRAINYLQKIKPEANHISHMWKKFNFVFDHAGHSQGGIQLYQKYCLEKKCTSCSIGNEILKPHSINSQ
jgi:hypothetical protein